MKNFPSFAILLALGVSLAFALTAEAEEKPAESAWGPSVEGFRLSLRSSQAQYAPGDKIEVQLVLQNVDSKKRVVARSRPLRVHEFQIIGPDGKLVLLTTQGMAILRATRYSSFSLMDLEPKEEHSASLELSDIYDLTNRGEYRVLASRQVWTRDDDKKFATLASNTLVIKVAEKDAKKDKRK